MRRGYSSHRSIGRRALVVRLLFVVMMAAGAVSQVTAAGAETLDADGAWAQKAAVVARSGDGVNVRIRPDATSKVLLAVADGTEVDLRLDESVPFTETGGTVWWPVSVNGIDGWIVGDYLALPGEDTSAPEIPVFAVGDRVQVATDDGSGLILRDAPSRDGEQLAILEDGATLTINEAATNDGWYAVNDGSRSAFVYGAYLVAASDDASTETKFAVNSYLTPADADAVNLRSNPSRSAAIRAVVAPGATALVTGEPRTRSNGEQWYPVSMGETTGWVLGSLMIESAAPAGPATGYFIFPVESYTITQNYGCTGFSLEPWSDTLGCYYHNGVDLANDWYTPIMAADGGVILGKGWCDCGLGYFLQIDHQNGFVTIYGHLAELPSLEIGQVVKQGEIVASMGSTGNSTGPHLHFIIQFNGETVDPFDYLP